MGKNFDELKKAEPRIVLKSRRTIPDPHNEEAEPTLIDVPIWDEEELEWAAGLLLEEKEQTGKLPSKLAGFYKPTGCRGWKLVVIIVTKAS